MGSINAFNIYYNYHDELEKLNDYDFPDEIGYPYNMFSKTGSYTRSSVASETGSKAGSGLIVQNKSKKKKPMSLLDRLKQKYSSPKPKYDPEPEVEIVPFAPKPEVVIASPDMAVYQDAYDAAAYEYANSYYDYVDPESVTEVSSTIAETSTIAELLSTVAPETLTPTELPTAPPTTTEQVYLDMDDTIYFNPEGEELDSKLEQILSINHGYFQISRRVGQQYSSFHRYRNQWSGQKESSSGFQMRTMNTMVVEILLIRSAMMICTPIMKVLAVSFSISYLLLPLSCATF